MVVSTAASMSALPVNPFARKSRARGLARWMPGLDVLRNYERAWLPKDLAAGVVLTTILVPVGMGYAAAAGLPVIYGLYATIVPLLAYALFGASRILVLGPDSALAGLIAATILPLAAGSGDRAVALAGMLALMSGGLCVLAGLFRLGFITDLLSKPIRYGYLNGIALTVLIAQLPKALGFNVTGENLLQELAGLAHSITHGAVNWTAASIAAACLVVIFGFKRWLPVVPGVLIAVVGATIVAAFFDLSAQTGIAVVGPLPQGLPAFRVPDVSLADIRALAPGAFAIALVSFADMSVLSRTFAQRGGYDVDRDQELLALGAANLAAGVFQGFSVTSSASRTPVAEVSGAKTQLTCVVGALCIALLLVAAPALLRDLPAAALAAVVIAACIGLVEVRGVLRLWSLRRGEFALSIVCFLGVALLGVVQGIFIAVALALAAFVWRAWRPYDAVLGRVDGLKGYHDVSRHPDARRIPGLVLFRWDAPLWFANAEIFQEHLLAAVADAPTPTKWVVVAAEPVTDVDVTAADMLLDLDRELHEAGIELAFAEMKGPVKDLLKRYGLFARFGDDYFFRTIGQAVDRYVAVNQVEWRDWED
jgi:high affinity sulfate transporter 1